MPGKKFNVVIIGENTRLASKIISAQAVVSDTPFIVHEQTTPQKPTSSVYYNNFISLNGDKLEACLKIVECPPDTAIAVTKDSFLKSILNDYLNQADLVIVSVSGDDKLDYSNTRLSGMLVPFQKKRTYYLDWP